MVEQGGSTVDPWIEAHGALRGLVVDVREFPGWENVTGFLHRFVRGHHRKVQQIALAAGGRLAEWAPRLAAHFVEAEVRRFGWRLQIVDARRKAPDPSATH